jgi:hypothetical protein
VWTRSRIREIFTIEANGNRSQLPNLSLSSRLMREKVQHSSVVCVLVGTDTWKGRWVKYEIARAVIDKKGLLSVAINGLPHVGTRQPDKPGFNPLDIMGVYEGNNGRSYLAEKRRVPTSTNPSQYGPQRRDVAVLPIVW